MPLLVEYDCSLVIFNCFGDHRKAESVMKKAIKIYWPNRKNKIARQRVKSACNIIRWIRKDLTQTQQQNAATST